MTEIVESMVEATDSSTNGGSYEDNRYYNIEYRLLTDRLCNHSPISTLPTGIITCDQPLFCSLYIMRIMSKKKSQK